jgi:hypothetical protein
MRPVGTGAQHGNPLTLAVLATFGLVLELLVVEKQLFPGCEHEIRATIDALQYLVLEFHCEEALPFPDPAQHGRPEWERIRFTTWAGDLLSPSYCPLGSARHAMCTAWLLHRTSYLKNTDRTIESEGRGRAPSGTAPPFLVVLTFVFTLVVFTSVLARKLLLNSLFGFSPALCELSCGCACAPALLLRVFFRRASGRTSDVLLP